MRPPEKETHGDLKRGPVNTQRAGHLWLVLILILGTTGCSILNLESPACTESKNALREFYSYHFGNEMKFSAAGLKQREKYLSPEFAKTVASAQEGTDPFTTGSDGIPKTFRVGDCRELSPEHTKVSVLIFWRSDDRTEQREIWVEARDRNDTWLVNNISR